MEKMMEKHVVPFYLCLSFAIISGIQLFGPSVDYVGYQRIFTFVFGERNPTEPFFTLLRIVNDTLFNSSLVSIYFFSAFLSLLIKWYAIKNLADSNCLIILMLYFCSLFLLHEYNQIRVACAISVFLLMLNDVLKGRNVRVFLEFCLAFCLHYSSAFILLFFIFLKVCKTKRSLFLFPLFGFLFAVCSKGFFSSWLRDSIYLFQNATGFNKSGGMSDFMSPFNMKYLVLLIFFSFYLYFIPLSDKKNMLLAKSMSFGLCFYYWLNPIQLPVISVRLAEYFTSVFVLYFMNASKYIPVKEKRVMLFVPVSVIALYSFATFRTTVLR